MLGVNFYPNICDFCPSEDLTHKAESPLKIHVLKKLLFNAMGFVKPAINFSLI